MSATAQASAARPSPALPAARSAAITRFVAGTRFEDVPAAGVDAAKRSILDALGCAVYGRDAGSVRLVRGLVLQRHGDDASLWADHGRASAADAALVNGTAIHATELSESFTRAAVHPGNVVVPLVLALAERERSHGRDVLTAVAVGYEVAIRLGLAFGGILLQQGLHSPTLGGVFGGAAAAARMLALGVDDVNAALGITACRVPTAMWAAAFQHADVKDLFQGTAAAIAIDAADDAMHGVTGPADWVGTWFGAVPRNPQLGGSTETLGSFWWTCSGGLHFKDLPVMAMAAPTLGALRSILERRRVPPDDVDAVVVESSGRIVLGRTYPPRNLVSARGSLPFLVAAILHDPEAFLRDRYFLDFITDERIADRSLDHLADKVELCVDPTFDHHMERAWPMRFEARVTLRLRSGEELVGYDDTWPRTSTMTYDDVAEKFRAMCRGAMPPGAVEHVIDQVRQLERSTDVADVLATLKPAHGQERMSGGPTSS